MSSPTLFSFSDLVFTHDANSVSLTPIHRTPYMDDLIADLNPPSDISLPLDFSLSSDSWHSSISFHYVHLISSSLSPSLSLYHSYLIGKLLHQEELRMLGRLSPSSARSCKNGRRLHTLFLRTVKHLGGSAFNRYRAARRVFTLYSTLRPQAIQDAQVITPNKLQKLTKQDFKMLYDHAKSIGTPSENYPFHISLFIGTNEL